MLVGLDSGGWIYLWGVLETSAELKFEERYLVQYTCVFLGGGGPGGCFISLFFALGIYANGY